GGSFTAGPFGIGQINVNNGTNQHLRPSGASRLLSNQITMTFGVAMDNATGESFDLTFAGVINMTGTSRFISNGFIAGSSGGTMVIGSASAPSTLTLPTTTNLTLSLAALSGPIVVNDVIQNFPTTSGNVTINPNANNSNAVTLNGANIYSGTT